MSVVFVDLQETDNPDNGKRFGAMSDIRHFLRSLEKRPPFLFELENEAGATLTVGLAGTVGCVQFTPVRGKPPYQMAFTEECVEAETFLEFLAGNTPTPISRRYCVPIKQVEDIILEFVKNGLPSPHTSWEEI